MLSLEEIKNLSPRYEHCWDAKTGERNIQMVFYSLSCCWWTSFAEDLGHTKIAQSIRNNNTAILQHSLPCCPYCGSPLFQSQLSKFLKAAEENPGHYGEKGLDVLMAAHHRNSKTCYKNWEKY